ncbi:MAG: TonB-dependent receptor, partial [Bacteroidia bacterium]
KGWSNRFRMVNQLAKNDFNYPDRSAQGSPMRAMEHAGSSMLAVLNETHYEFKRWKTGVDFWYQKANRQIPPTLLSLSIATQDDESIRLNAFVSYADSLRFVQFNSAMFAENLWYHDPAKNLNGLNHSTRWLNQLQFRRKFRHLSLQAGALHQLDQAGSNSYLQEKVQLHTAAAYLAAYGQLLKNKRLFWKTDIRQEFRKSLIPTPSFSAGMDYLLNRRNTLSGHLAHISRLPNLNDLYWNPGGDPDLRPEKGFSGEFTYAYTYSKVNTLVQARLTAFYSVIHQWIIWLPDNGYWTPQNLQQVHNRGFEWETKLLQHHKNDNISLTYGGSFTLASNEKAKNEQDLSVGKQLIYVPFWKNYIALSLPYKNFLLSYRHSFTGGRYTSSDNLSFLRPYSTGDLELGCTHELKQHRLNASLGVQNIWNVYYESIEWRPMPGRYYQLSITYQFIHKKINP